MKKILTFVLTFILMISFVNAEDMTGETEFIPNYDTTNFDSLETSGNLEIESITVDGQNILQERETYIYYYGNGCSHCAKVDKYLTDTNGYEKLDILKKEVWFNEANQKEFSEVLQRLNLTNNTKIGVPFLLINNAGTETYIDGDTTIINYFSEFLGEEINNSESNQKIFLIIIGVLAIALISFVLFRK